MSPAREYVAGNPRVARVAWPLLALALAAGLFGKWQMRPDETWHTMSPTSAVSFMVLLVLVALFLGYVIQLATSALRAGQYPAPNALLPIRQRIYRGHIATVISTLLLITSLLKLGVIAWMLSLLFET